MDINELKWTTQSGETFLTVGPEDALKWVNQDIEEACLQAGFLNADAKRIHVILREAKNKPEYVGPWIQKIDSKRFDQVLVKVEEDKASLTLLPEAFKDSCITVKEIDFCLRRFGIKACVDLPTLSNLIRDKKANVETIVARRKEPEKGSDAVIQYKIKFTEATRPKLLADGSVDFRNLDQIIHIKEKQLLAIKTPPKMGVEGQEITGENLPALMGEDFPLEGGENTELSPNGLELTAKYDGFAYEDLEKRLSVGRLYVVEGDLNFKYGNIKYQGDVLVKGNILPGFEIIASGSVVIEGEVDQARIIAGGDVKISGGIFGKNKCVIQTKGNLFIRMAQDCVLESGKTLSFELYIADSKIKAKTLLSKSINGVLRNCQVSVFEKLSVGQIGSESSGLCEIAVLYEKDEELKARILEATKLLEETQIGTANLLKRLQTMKAILKRSTEVSPKSMEEIQKVMADYQESQRKEEAYSRKIDLIQKNRANRSGFHGRVEANHYFPPAVIKMFEEAYEIKTPTTRSALVWSSSVLVSENLLPNWSPGK